MDGKGEGKANRRMLMHFRSCLYDIPLHNAQTNEGEEIVFVPVLPSESDVGSSTQHQDKKDPEVVDGRNTKKY